MQIVFFWCFLRSEGHVADRGVALLAAGEVPPPPKRRPFIKCCPFKCLLRLSRAGSKHPSTRKIRLMVVDALLLLLLLLLLQFRSHRAVLCRLSLFVLCLRLSFALGACTVPLSFLLGDLSVSFSSALKEQ